MSDMMRKYAVATAKCLSSPEAAGLPCVHLIYRVGEGGILQRAQTRAFGRNNVIGLYDGGGLIDADADKLSKDLILEISRRNYSGVMLDFPADEKNTLKLERLCELLIRKNVTVFLPYDLAPISSEAKIIVPMSVSGGSLKEMIETAADRIKPQRMCAEIKRNCYDFTMPSYKPDGKPINSEQLQKIIADHSPTPFFSDALGCKYFTYRTKGESHFILFDDFDSACCKIKLASSLKLFAAFITFSEWGPVSREILSF